MKSKRDLPSKNIIRKHWLPLLTEMNKEINEYDFCFACSSITNAERAHIIPKVLGGSDDADNLHLLCPTCHKDSELLSGENYFAWFIKRTLTDKLLSFYLRNGGSLSDLLCLQELINSKELNEVLKTKHQELLEQERKSSISIRTREALKAKAARGERLGNIENLNKNRHIRASLARQEAVCFYNKEFNEIKIMIEQGFTLRKIAKQMNSKGYKTKEGKEFHPMTIKRIFDRMKTFQS